MTCSTAWASEVKVNRAEPLRREFGVETERLERKPDGRAERCAPSALARGEEAIDADGVPYDISVLTGSAHEAAAHAPGCPAAGGATHATVDMRR